MAPALELPVAPGGSKLNAVAAFDRPLLPAGTTTPVEDLALATALENFAKRNVRDDFSELQGFLRNNPDSAWSPGLEAQLGHEYYRVGRYSKAIAAWRHVWESGRSAPDEVASSVASEAGSELALMYARLGRMTELGPLLAELNIRPTRGMNQRALRGASDGFWSMQHRPEVSFRCGPLALDRICFATDRAKAGNQLIQDSQSTTDGFSAAQVAALSRSSGMNYQVAFRSPGAEIILPAVVHWKVGHYAALIARDEGLIRAEDPTFGNHKIWLSGAALDDESSGYFLVRSGPLPSGWRMVSDTEAAGIWGKGTTEKSDEDATSPYDQSTCSGGGSSSAGGAFGMAQWNVHLLLASHHVEDTPVGYTPPVGPPIYINASYDAVNGWPDYGLPYSNISQEWRLNWLAYVTDDPMNPAGDVRFAANGGGTLTFTDFNLTNQVFQNLFYNRASLVRTGTNSYEIRYPDGSKRIFDQPDNSIGTTRRIFMGAVVDPSGNAATLQYDLPGRIISVTDATGQKTQFLYEMPNDNTVPPTLHWVPPYVLTRVVDPFGRTAVFDFGGSAINARLGSITDAIGMTSSFRYDYNPGLPDLGMTNLITAYGTTVFSRGSYSGIYRANWVEITHPNGEKERVEYSEKTPAQVFSTEPLSIVPKGVPVRNYILWARNTYHWDRKAYAEGYSPNDYTKARIYHWTHGQDYNTASPILESFKMPLEHRIWFNYDGQVNPTFVGTSDRPTKIARTLEDGTTQLYQHEYNSLNNPTKAIDPLGRELTFIYDPNEMDLIEVRQTRAGQNELLLSATYDARHRPLTITDASRQTTTFSYNGRGQVLTVTNPRGDTTSYTYDANGYLTDIDGPLPGPVDTSHFTYDLVGRLQTATDIDGYALTFDYDDLDRPTRVTYPDGSYKSITYNRLDPEVLRDRAGRQTKLTFDSFRQLISTQDPLGRVTHYDWCGCGGLSAIIDPMGRATSWVRDVQGRVSTKVYADGSKVQYAYDTAIGWLKSSRDGQNQVTSFDYNVDGTLRQKSCLNAVIATPTVQFVYDPNYSRLSQIQDGEGTTTYAYYPITSSTLMGAGHLASIDGPWANDTITYQYDELRRVSSLAINGVGEKRSFDPAGRLSQVTNVLGTFSFTWEGASRRLSTVQYPNGQHSLYTYHPNLRDQLLQSITHYLPNEAVLSQFTYGYDAIPRLTNWTQLQGGALKTWAPTYDAADRLLGVTETPSIGAPHSYNYEYDASDNRIADQTDLNRAEISYNDLNQLIASTNSPAAGAGYTWDAANRLVAITDGSHHTDFTYDGFGRRTRIVETENGSVTSDRRYLWCGAELCEERDSSGATVLKRFSSRGMRTESGGDLPVGSYFFTRDHLRSLREMTDSTGALHAQYAYSPFGIRQSLGGDLNADFGFTGHFVHQLSGLNLALYRSYSPYLGRWLNRDPLGEPGGLNLYQYARSDPLNVIDVYGLEGNGWGIGISGELAFVQPFTPGGGGAQGINLQYLSVGPDEGLSLFTYSPGQENSTGVNIGASIQLNYTWGNGEWIGPFENYALGVDKFGGGYFKSPCVDQTGEGWKGYSAALGVGPSPFTAAEYTTEYRRSGFLDWLNNLLGGPLWY